MKTYPGLSVPLSDSRAHNLDFVLVRESTEGLFSSRDENQRTEEAAQDTLLITRSASERIFDFAFELAREQKSKGLPGKVTCVDKANVLGSLAYFREIFQGCAEKNSDIEADCCYVDAMALRFIRNPWVNDVVVTENMFGDILSDAGAGLMGGMGFAPSADIGLERAIFQPCHGTAPDIAGSGKANPTAMFLSAAMMLEWLGERHQVSECKEAGARLHCAVEKTYAECALYPYETGGKSGLKAITDAVAGGLNSS